MGLALNGAVIRCPSCNTCSQVRRTPNDLLKDIRERFIVPHFVGHHLLLPLVPQQPKALVVPECLFKAVNHFHLEVGLGKPVAGRHEQVLADFVAHAIAFDEYKKVIRQCLHLHCVTAEEILRQGALGLAVPDEQDALAFAVAGEAAKLPLLGVVLGSSSSSRADASRLECVYCRV